MDCYVQFVYCCWLVGFCYAVLIDGFDGSCLSHLQAVLNRVDRERKFASLKFWDASRDD